MCSFRYFFILLVLISSSVFSAPYDGDTLTLKQPDGTLVQVRAFGDEFYIRLESLDGYTLTQNPNNRWIEYARLNTTGTDFISTGIRYKDDGSSKARSGAVDQTPPQVRSQVPKSVDLDKNTRLQQSQANRVLLRRDDSLRPSNKTLARNSTSLIGNVVGLTLLADFPDSRATLPQARLDNYLNQLGYEEDGNNGSVRDYFRDVSGNKLDYTNYVTQYYTARYNKSYYTDPQIPYGQRARELAIEAMTYLDAQGFDFSTLSTDEYGWIRSINLFYAGYIENAWAQGLWPHQGGIGGEFSADGVTAMAYQVTNIGDYPTLGTFCHENGHMLFHWPDLYDYDYDSAGVGNYDLMGYFGPALNPVPPNAFFRSEAGWDTVTAISLHDAPANYSHQANSNTSFSYANPDNSNEFFFIESRLQEGRNTGLPDDGLLIWHIDRYGSNSWQQMTPELHYHVSVEQADARFDLEQYWDYGSEGDLFHQAHRNEFSEWTLPDSRWWSGKSSGLNIVDIGPIAAAMEFSVIAGNYRTKDIGNPGLAGTATLLGTVTRLEGGGAGIDGAFDQFLFHYTSLPKDGEVTARINEFEGASSAAKAGLMIRQTTDAGSVFVMLAMTPERRLALVSRTVADSSSNSYESEGSLPRWLKLDRSRDQVIAFQSQDGATWEEVGRVSLPLEDGAVLAGLAVTSNDNTTLATAVFEDFAVNRSVWNARDIDSPALPGTYSIEGGSFILQGSGADIGGYIDQFFFLSQPFVGEGRITARVASLTNTHPAAKAGVMLRSNFNYWSPNAFMAVTPGSGTTFQRRLPEEGNTRETVQPGIAPPQWVRLENRNGYIIGYQSSDGQNWEEVGRESSYSINPLHVGLAVTSHNSEALATAVFDNVTVQTGFAYLDVTEVQYLDQEGGNGDGVLNPGEEILISAKVANYGSAPALGVKVRLAVDDECITLLNPDPIFYGDVPQGSSVGPGEFNLRISESCPHGHYVALPFEMIEASGNVMVQTAFVQVIEAIDELDEFQITTSANAGGSITPEGVVTVKKHADQTFTIAANSGYRIADVLVNGQSLGSIESYTFFDLQAHQTIAAVFVPKVTTCDDQIWLASIMYLEGNFVVHNGHRWRAKWWTLGEEPGTSNQWGSWEDLGPCAV